VARKGQWKLEIFNNELIYQSDCGELNVGVNLVKNGSMMDYSSISSVECVRTVSLGTSMSYTTRETLGMLRGVETRQCVWYYISNNMF